MKIYKHDQSSLIQEYEHWKKVSCVYRYFQCWTIIPGLYQKKSCLHRYDFTIKLRILGLYEYWVYNARGVFPACAELTRNNLHQLLEIIIFSICYFAFQMTIHDKYLFREFCHYKIISLKGLELA